MRLYHAQWALLLSACLASSATDADETQLRSALPFPLISRLLSLPRTTLSHLPFFHEVTNHMDPDDGGPPRLAQGMSLDNRKIMPTKPPCEGGPNASPTWRAGDLLQELVRATRNSLIQLQDSLQTSLLGPQPSFGPSQGPFVIGIPPDLLPHIPKEGRAQREDRASNTLLVAYTYPESDGPLTRNATGDVSGQGLESLTQDSRLKCLSEAELQYILRVLREATHLSNAMVTEKLRGQGGKGTSGDLTLPTMRLSGRARELSKQLGIPPLVLTDDDPSNDEGGGDSLPPSSSEKNPKQFAKDVTKEVGVVQRELVMLRLMSRLSGLERNESNRHLQGVGSDGQRGVAEAAGFGDALSGSDLGRLSTVRPFSDSTYLPNLHMESLSVRQSNLTPIIRHLLSSDPAVTGVYLDGMIKVDTIPSSHPDVVLLDDEDGSDITGTATAPKASLITPGDEEDAVLGEAVSNGTESSSRRHLSQASALVTPNDRFFSRQWSLMAEGGAANVQRAWSIYSGDGEKAKVTVALIDSGIDLKHVDLQGRQWLNVDEICDNGIDDDDNGYVDDCYGWDFFDNDNIPMDENGHGTASAGIIAAIPNNHLGIAPICWNCELMNLRTLGPTNVGAISGFIKALDYALGKGAKLSNNSWGIQAEVTAALKEAVRRTQSAGMVFVVAAGNFGGDNDNPKTAARPASYNLDNMISVAAVGEVGDFKKFSSYGRTSVHLGAPGSNILAPALGRGYTFSTGTSFSAPHVTAVVGLLMGLLPASTPYADLIKLVVDNTRPLTSLQGRTITGGTLDAEKVLQAAARKLVEGSDVTRKVSSMSQKNDAASAQRLTDPCIVLTKDVQGRLRGVDPCPNIVGARCLSLGSTYDCRCPSGSAWDGEPSVRGGACRRIVLPTSGRCRNNGDCGINSLCQVSRGFLGISRATCSCMKGYEWDAGTESVCVPIGMRDIGTDAYLSLVEQA